MEMDFHCEKFWHRVCGSSQQYPNLSLLRAESMSQKTFPEAVSSRDATFCPAVEQDIRNINKIDNISRMKKQMKHMN